MTAPIEQFSFKPTSDAGVPPASPTYLPGAVKRPAGDQFGDIVNVKNFGAVGNGIVDDTAAIQLALNAAFCYNGNWSTPHGTDTGAGTCDLNRPVFFPNGQYAVAAPTALTISNAFGVTTFTVTAANATVGATYTNNGVTYTVQTTIVGGTTLVGTFTATTSVTTGATLTKTSGTGDATITFSVRDTNIRCTTSSTTNWLTNWIGYVTGIVGTAPGSPTDATFENIANRSAGLIIVDGTTVDLRSSEDWTTSSYSSGGTIPTSALHVAGVMGGHIYGAGRFSTKISSSNGGALQFNGYGYGRLEGIEFGSGGFATVDLNWDGVTVQGTQSNTINDCFFSGGQHCLSIGSAGFMSSETLILNCYFIGATVSGLHVSNSNAVGNSIVGGNIASCPIGINCTAGIISLIHGVHFQVNSTFDISLDSNASGGDGCSIHGCRTESGNFVRTHAGLGVEVVCCTQTSGGTFLSYEAGPPGPGCGSIINCGTNGGVIAGNGDVTVIGSAFNTTINGDRGFGAATAGFTGRIIDWNIGPLTVTDLPTAGTKYQGLRETVTNSSLAYTSSNIGLAVSAGSSVGVFAPVICTSTAWVIG